MLKIAVMYPIYFGADSFLICIHNFENLLSPQAHVPICLLANTGKK